MWQALERVEHYQQWWPWLRRFDARSLATGERWRARIRVPMPWMLRFELELQRVDAPTSVDATVAGDVEGTASITVEPEGVASRIRLQSALAPRHRLLAGVHRLVPSVSRRLHDRVVDEAFRQFASRDRARGHRPKR